MSTLISSPTGDNNYASMYWVGDGFPYASTCIIVLLFKVVKSRYNLNPWLVRPRRGV